MRVTSPHLHTGHEGDEPTPTWPEGLGGESGLKPPIPRRIRGTPRASQRGHQRPTPERGPRGGTNPHLCRSVEVTAPLARRARRERGVIGPRRPNSRAQAVAESEAQYERKRPQRWLSHAAGRTGSFRPGDNPSHQDDAVPTRRAIDAQAPPGKGRRAAQANVRPALPRDVDIAPRRCWYLLASSRKTGGRADRVTHAPHTKTAPAQPPSAEDRWWPERPRRVTDRRTGEPSG